MIKDKNKQMKLVFNSKPRKAELHKNWKQMLIPLNSHQSCSVNDSETKNQDNYLKEFDSIKNGSVHEQFWAKANIKKFHKSVEFFINELSVIIVKAKGKSNTFKDLTVRKQIVHNALLWLIQNNPHYCDLQINATALNSLSENGVPPDLMTVETDDDIVSDDNCSPDFGSPTDNPSEDIVYNDSTEMSSFLPVGEQQQQEIDAQSGIFLKQNPGEAHLTIDELREMAASNNSNVFMSKLSRYVGNANAYWSRVREELRAIITSVGAPTLFFTFSSADMHWPELHALLKASTDCETGSYTSNTALKGFLAQKFKDENDCSDTTELDQDIEAGQKAADTVCQHVDWLLSTVNPNPPDEDMWIRPEVHPCQRSHHDIPEHEKQSDYVDLLNIVQRHTRCSTSYCLRKKSNETELKCRFHFPFDICPKTKLEFEKIHTSGDYEHYRAKIVTKRNDSRLNNHQQLQLQGWRANCDIQVVIDHHACVEYLTKYAAKENIIPRIFPTYSPNPKGPNFGLHCKYHLLRANYSEQQIQEMPTWIKTNKEEYTIDEQYVVDINSFSEMQKLAYDIVKSHFDDVSSEKESLCLIINGVAGTGKSYLINAIRNLLQSKCTVTAITDKRCKQATGYNDKVFGGKSLILTGDPGQLPPVADKPFYRAKPSNAVGEQGYQAYHMFDKVVKLTVNQRVQDMTSEQVQFRD
ncbi:Hypothetical predicted protein [Paramuricea clavata]|uniref:Uncharacterized protein n=1 Tax=Paramuricea clavata TaxID=317549 RepID=A0A6S7IUQ9_PARCT|nr:Hypothetical predicted protein [Paramuricea clavata]